MLTDREISLLFAALHHLVMHSQVPNPELKTLLIAASDSRYDSMLKLAGVTSDEVAALKEKRTFEEAHRRIPPGALVYVTGQPGGNTTAHVDSSEMIDGALHYTLVNFAGEKPFRTHYSNVRRITETNTGSSPDGFVPFLRF